MTADAQTTQPDPLDLLIKALRASQEGNRDAALFWIKKIPKTNFGPDRYSPDWHQYLLLTKHADMLVRSLRVGNVEDLHDLLRNIYADEINRLVRQYEKMAAAGKLSDAVEIGDKITKGHRIYALVLDKGTKNDVFKDTRFESFADFKKITTDLIAQKCEAALDTLFDGCAQGDYEKAYAAYIDNFARKHDSGADFWRYGVFAEGAKTPCLDLPVNILEAYAAKKGVSMDSIMQADRNLAIYMHLKAALISFREERRTVQWTTAEKRLGEFSKACSKFNITTLDDVDPSIMHALDNDAPGSYEYELRRCQLIDDVACVTRSRSYPYPAEKLSSFSLVDEPQAVRDLAAYLGVPSIFDVTPKKLSIDGSKGYTAERARQDLRQVLALYRRELREKNHPAYPAAEVEKDYRRSLGYGQGLSFGKIADVLKGKGDLRSLFSETKARDDKNILPQTMSPFHRRVFKAFDGDWSHAPGVNPETIIHDRVRTSPRYATSRDRLPSRDEEQGTVIENHLVLTETEGAFAIHVYESARPETQGSSGLEYKYIASLATIPVSSMEEGYTLISSLWPEMENISQSLSAGEPDAQTITSDLKPESVAA